MRDVDEALGDINYRPFGLTTTPGVTVSVGGKPRVLLFSLFLLTFYLQLVNCWFTPVFLAVPTCYTTIMNHPVSNLCFYKYPSLGLSPIKKEIQMGAN